MKFKQILYNLFNIANTFPIKAKSKEHLKKIINRQITSHGIHCDLNHIDVSEITDMSGLFEGSKFNGNISNWNVACVKNMDSMFYGSHFNGDISKWSVSAVTNMERMFENSLFAGDLSLWDTSNVLSFYRAFSASIAPRPYWYEYGNVDTTAIEIKKYRIPLEEKENLQNALPQIDKRVTISKI